MKVTKIDQPEHASVTAEVNPEHARIKDTLISRGVNSPRVPRELETIPLSLFNLEPSTAPEKPLGLKLNLYQMENP